MTNNEDDNPYLKQPSTASYGGGDPMRTGNFGPGPNNPYLSGRGDPMRTGNPAPKPNPYVPPKSSVYDQAVNESLPKSSYLPQQMRAARGPAENGTIAGIKRFAGRVADSFRRTPTMFNAAAAKALGESPESYAYRTSENVFTDPARSRTDRLADGIGNIAAQVTDPFALAASFVTGGPVTGALVGGAFEGGKSLLTDSARGDERDYLKAAGNAMGGAVGGGAAAKYIPVGRFGNDATETAGRMAGSEFVEWANPLANGHNPYLEEVERRRKLAAQNRPY